MAFTGKKIYMMTKSPNAVTQVGTDEAPVASETYVDLPNYDNGNYRDEFFAQSVADVNTPTAFPIKLNVNAVADAPYLVKTTDTGTDTTASINPGVSTADDKVLHVPPRNEAKKRTLIKFWSAASGTGDQLGEVWADKFVQWTGFQPVRF